MADYNAGRIAGPVAHAEISQFTIGATDADFVDSKEHLTWRVDARFGEVRFNHLPPFEIKYD
jgi:hypothetical protein